MGQLVVKRSTITATQKLSKGEITKEMYRSIVDALGVRG